MTNKILYGLLISMALISCNKEKAVTNNNLGTTNTPTIKGRLLTKVIDLFGITFKVTFKDGCYHSLETYHRNGSIASRQIWCTQGCNFCEAIAVTRLDIPVATNEVGVKSLNVSEATDDNLFSGIISKSSEGNSLIFAVDRTKITSNTYNNLFSEDSVEFDNGYMISSDLIDSFELNWNQQFIPAGKYILYEDGNIIWWETPLNN